MTPMKTNDTRERLSPAAGSVSDTPRTDAHQLKEHMAYDRLWSDFARQLERERNDLSGALLKARMMLAHINLFISHDDPLYADVVAYFASDSQNVPSPTARW